MDDHLREIIVCVGIAHVQEPSRLVEYQSVGPRLHAGSVATHGTGGARRGHLELTIFNAVEGAGSVSGPASFLRTRRWSIHATELDALLGEKMP